MSKGGCCVAYWLVRCREEHIELYVEKKLLEKGLKVELLDADIIRANMSESLGFSKKDRDTNVRRITFMYEVLSKNGTVAIAAVVSPYRETRNEVGAKIKDFIEVYVKCPLDVLIKRDKKGLYQKAKGIKR